MNADQSSHVPFERTKRMSRDKYSIQNSRLLPGEIPGIRLRVKGDHLRGIPSTTTVYQEADRYGVGVETIRRAVRGETFRNVREGLAPLPEDDVGPKYGRRATDVVSEEDAKASLERLTSKPPEEPPDLNGSVDDFLNRRKGGEE